MARSTARSRSRLDRAPTSGRRAAGSSVERGLGPAPASGSCSGRARRPAADRRRCPTAARSPSAVAVVVAAAGPAEQRAALDPERRQPGRAVPLERSISPSSTPCWRRGCARRRAPTTSSASSGSATRSSIVERGLVRLRCLPERVRFDGPRPSGGARAPTRASGARAQRMASLPLYAGARGSSSSWPCVVGARRRGPRHGSSASAGTSTRFSSVS